MKITSKNRGEGAGAPPWASCALCAPRLGGEKEEGKSTPARLRAGHVHLTTPSVVLLNPVYGSDPIRGAGAMGPQGFHSVASRYANCADSRRNPSCSDRKEHSDHGV